MQISIYSNETHFSWEICHCSHFSSFFTNLSLSLFSSCLYLHLPIFPSLTTSCPLPLFRFLIFALPLHLPIGFPLNMSLFISNQQPMSLRFISPSPSPCVYLSALILLKRNPYGIIWMQFRLIARITNWAIVILAISTRFRTYFSLFSKSRNGNQQNSKWTNIGWKR